MGRGSQGGIGFPREKEAVQERSQGALEEAPASGKVAPGCGKASVPEGSLWANTAPCEVPPTSGEGEDRRASGGKRGGEARFTLVGGEAEGTSVSSIAHQASFSFPNNGCERWNIRFFDCDRGFEDRKDPTGPRQSSGNQLEGVGAILRGLEAGKDLLRGRHVVLYTDNMTARAAVARQGTQRLSSKAWELSKAIVDRAEELGARFLPRHVPGRLNAHADALSLPSKKGRRGKRH